jgi:hypothetical protein
MKELNSLCTDSSPKRFFLFYSDVQVTKPNYFRDDAGEKAVNKSEEMKPMRKDQTADDRQNATNTWKFEQRPLSRRGRGH